MMINLGHSLQQNRLSLPNKSLTGVKGETTPLREKSATNDQVSFERNFRRTEKSENNNAMLYKLIGGAAPLIVGVAAAVALIMGNEGGISLFGSGGKPELVPVDAQIPTEQIERNHLVQIDSQYGSFLLDPDGVKGDKAGFNNKRDRELALRNQLNAQPPAQPVENVPTQTSPPPQEVAPQ